MIVVLKTQVNFIFVFDSEDLNTNRLRIHFIKSSGGVFVSKNSLKSVNFQQNKLTTNKLHRCFFTLAERSDLWTFLTYEEATHVANVKSNSVVTLFVFIIYDGKRFEIGAKLKNFILIRVNINKTINKESLVQSSININRQKQKFNLLKFP